jgi:hypothetical protein
VVFQSLHDRSNQSQAQQCLHHACFLAGRNYRAKLSCAYLMFLPGGQQLMSSSSVPTACFFLAGNLIKIIQTRLRNVYLHHIFSFCQIDKPSSAMTTSSFFLVNSSNVPISCCFVTDINKCQGSSLCTSWSFSGCSK